MEREIKPREREKEAEKGEGFPKIPKRKDFLKGRRLEKRELIESIRKREKTFLKRKKSLEEREKTIRKHLRERG